MSYREQIGGWRAGGGGKGLFGATALLCCEWLHGLVHLLKLTEVCTKVCTTLMVHKFPNSTWKQAIHLCFKGTLALSKQFLKCTVTDIWTDILIIFSSFSNCEQGTNHFNSIIIEPRNSLTIDKARPRKPSGLTVKVLCLSDHNLFPINYRIPRG